MSAADTIADLVGAMRAAVIVAESGSVPKKSAGSADPCARSRAARLGDDQDALPVGPLPPKLGMRPRGAAARIVVWMSTLWAAGWEILPLPSYRASAEALTPRLSWSGRIEWIAVPPEGSKLKPRRFKGPGLAQIWAWECTVKANAEALAQCAVMNRRRRGRVAGSGA